MQLFLEQQQPQQATAAHNTPFNRQQRLDHNPLISCRSADKSDTRGAIYCARASSSPHPVLWVKLNGNFIPSHLWCTFVLSHTLQGALESGKEARIVQIDFSAAFDRVKRSPVQSLCRVVTSVTHGSPSPQLVCSTYCTGVQLLGRASAPPGGSFT